MDLTFGARLRQQRERQQVDLAAISEETKINVALLEGLERDDLSRWPRGLFRRAYVRAYADRIGLEPEQILREFAERHPEPVEEPIEAIAEQAGVSRRPRTRLGLLISDLATRRLARVSVVRPGASTPAAPADPVEVPAPSAVLEETVTASSAAEPAVDAAPAPRLVKVPGIEPAQTVRAERHLAERHLVAAARLCSRIACAADERDLTSVLGDIVSLLDAHGAILWIWDEERAALCPVLAHGYPDEVLQRLPLVRRSTDNAIALSFRAGQKRIVRGDDETTGAFVVPMLSPDGCIGVLAFEFSNGGEQHELPQALATIVASQLSALCTAAPPPAEGEWPRSSESLAAS